MVLIDDSDLKAYFESINVNDILHSFRPGITQTCVCCGYYLSTCWLCRLCEFSCKMNEEKNEIIESVKEDKKQEKIFNSTL